MVPLLLAAVLIIILCFGLVVFFGAPYLPTLSKQIDTALDLADLRPGETLLELGCGDGRVLVAAARRGWQSVGYELNPVLYIICRLRTWRYRRQVRISWGNFLTQQWPPAQAIFIFGFKTIMPKVDKKIMQSTRGSVKLVSFAFEIPNKRWLKHRHGVYLYEYHGR